MGEHLGVTAIHEVQQRVPFEINEVWEGAGVPRECSLWGQHTRLGRNGHPAGYEWAW